MGLYLVSADVLRNPHVSRRSGVGGCNNPVFPLADVFRRTCVPRWPWRFLFVVSRFWFGFEGRLNRNRSILPLLPYLSCPSTIVGGGTWTVVDEHTAEYEGDYGVVL